MDYCGWPSGGGSSRGTSCRPCWQRFWFLGGRLPVAAWQDENAIRKKAVDRRLTIGLVVGDSPVNGAFEIRTKENPGSFHR